MKKKALIDAIIKKGYLGHCVAHIHTIEYQKRGLPHMHLLVIVDTNSRVRVPADVDNVIRAEFPDPDDEKEKVLYEKVLAYMVHECTPACKPNGTENEKYVPTRDLLWGDLANLERQKRDERFVFSLKK